MKYMCNICYEIFKEEYFPNAEKMATENKYHRCPAIKCYGSIMPIEDGVVEAISILNKKNYFTMSSGKGNVYLYDENVYVKFMFDYYEFANIPPQFEYIKEKMLLRGTTEDDPAYSDERQIALFDEAKNLLKWAMELPEHELADDCEFRDEILENTGKIENQSKHLHWKYAS